MTKKNIIDRIDQFLRPLGFERRDMLWNRKRGSIIEVVDVQISKAGDAATINAGVLDVIVYEAVWGSEPPNFVEEPFCIVRARVGEIAGGHDLWWQVKDKRTPDNMVAALEEGVIDFLEKNLTLEAIEARLENELGSIPLPQIYLAIIKYQLGHVSEACAILKRVFQRSRGDWRDKAARIAARFECGAESA